jgi:PAS domain S-box-containing protein
MYKAEILNWLKKTDIPLTAISKKSGISRSTLYNWLNGSPVRDRNLGKLIDVYGEEIQIVGNINITEKDSLMNVDVEYIVGLQKDKITYLEKELVEKNALIKRKPKERPKTLDEISDMLHDASERWNWVFYKTDKPMSCTRKGILRNVNPALCKLLGYGEDEMLGKSLLEFIHPDDHKRAVREMKKSTRNIQLRVCKSNGKYCNMYIQAQEFGTNGNTFSVGMLSCCEKGCPDL